jgi:type IV secretory pathway TrbD component
LLLENEQMNSSRDVPTIYVDPRTIYTQPPTLYDPPHDRPRPAAPAASAEPEPTPAVSLPTPPNVWQRRHHQPLATRTSSALAPALPTLHTSRGAADDNVAIGNIVYQSLQRPKLLRGGEWQLSVATNLTAAAFVILAIMTWNWRFLPGALFFGGPIQWLLRVLADYDPKRWQKYVRTIGQPLVREAHGKPGDSAPPPRILPKPSLFIH